MENGESILAEGCRRGDAASRQALYERYAGRLMSVCLRYAGERATAEDLLHDAFLKIFASIDRFSYRGPGSLRAWMERVTANVAIEWLRRRSRMTAAPLDGGCRSMAEEAEEPGATEVAAVPRDVLLRFVAELPDGYRAVFNLYCMEGYSHREIARMLGIGEKSSSSQLFRARALLAGKVRAYMQKEGL